MVRLRSRAVIILFALLPAIGLFPSLSNAAERRSRDFEALDPGAFVARDLTVPVRLVFIGYDPARIDKAALLAGLPATYNPLVRFPQYYGLSGRDLGLRYRFRYSVTFKDAQFTNRFFSFLKRTGTDGAPTAFQDAYNAQAKNVLDVTGPVLYIDAPTVERYLAGCDGDDARSYTIYFINWYGRPDFRFHVYQKIDEPDPDTHFNFGLLRASRKMIAWGGTSSRAWFYDLSAGPEAWTNNWIVDDDQTQYHMPPVWEYAAGGYRPPAQLTTDLALVTRYVGINLLFTTSPLYDPLVTAPDAGGAKVAHIAMLEDDPASRGLDFVNRSFTQTELRRFQPYYRWKVGLTDKDPIDAGAKRALSIAGETLAENDCWNTFGLPFAQLFCYFEGNLASYIPRYGKRDYVGEIFAFNTTDESLGVNSNLLGFADDNWVDGTQSFVFMFNTAGFRELGFGFTSTAIHEFGHHIGMSHPHDGYDSETGVDYGAAGDFEFAWSGDETHSVMQYIAVTNQFGQFDKDNMYRWETAGYLNWANAVAGDILAHPRGAHARPLLRAADLLAADSLAAFRRWDLLRAATEARGTYALVAALAQQLGVETPTLSAAQRRLPGEPFTREGCRIRHPED